MLLILLFLPNVQGDATGPTAASIEATTTSVAGLSRGVVISAELAAHVASMNLTAASVDGIVEVSRNEVFVEPFAIDPETHRQEPIHLADVHSTSFAAPEGALILIAPTGTALVLKGNLSGQLEPYGGGDLSFASYANSTRPPTALSSHGTVLLTGSDGYLTVSGDFELVIWGANVTFQSASGATFVQTGLEREPVGPAPPGMSGVEHTTAREAHLLLVNGSLTFPVTDAASVFAPSARLAGLADNSVFTLSGAKGTFSLAGQRIPLNGEDLQILGKVNVALESRSDAFMDANVSGRPQAVYVGGVAVDVFPPDTSPAWPFLAAIPVVAVLVALVARRRRGQNLVADLDGLMRQERFLDAVAAARRLQRYPRFAEDGVVAEAVALVKLGRPDEARTVLQDRPVKGRRIAGRNFLRARMAAADGHLEEALQFLAACLTESPAYTQDARADPVLGPLLKEVEKRESRNVGGYA